ncbi:VOC family protein [Sphingopyxis sp. MWB1]|uniref:VOC family protein n=1 Tax=Sphingopyxis sp. MWB1 TaxID=1537715 RepID=UPI00051A092F|nr:VOC family protein [Sphingopyxis sp. MWB1]
MTQSDESFIWYELMTPDPDAAARFYGAVIGWAIAAHSDPGAPGGVDYRMIVRGDGSHAGGVLRLGAEMIAGGAHPGWLGYLYAADVDAAVDAIVADGGAVHMGAHDLPVGRMAMVSDPQGAVFYLMNPIPPAGKEKRVSGVFSMTEAQHIRWNELAAPDPDAAIAFYKKHFGWEQEGGVDMGEMGQYHFVQKGQEGVGAVMPMTPETPAPGWYYYIGVDDIDRAVAAVTSEGGALLHDPMQIPGGEFSVVGSDPQGAIFGLVGPRKG